MKLSPAAEAALANAIWAAVPVNGMISAPVDPAPENSSAPCAFCGTLTANTPGPKWLVCLRPTCQDAVTAHKERIYAGLVDCPETRRDALRWVKAREQNG